MSTELYSQYLERIYKRIFVKVDYLYKYAEYVPYYFDRAHELGHVASLLFRRIKRVRELGC